jgi:chromosome segregation ATPase
MATENVKILTVKTAESEKSIKSLKKEIGDLRDSILNLEKGSEEYARAVEQLQQDQRELDEVMSLTKKTATALDGSYDALVHQMALLKKEWRATNDEARRAELGKQVLEINNKLKDLDASTGNFQRNVGDYKNQMVGAFKATAGAASDVINPLEGMNNGLKAISKTPVIAILGLLANLINAVIKNLKSSEENMMALSGAFGIFQGVGNAVTKLFQNLGGVLTKVGDWLGRMADKLGLVTDDMKAQQAIIKETNQLTLDQRKVNEQNADSELKISQLKQKAADKINYTHKERLVFLKQALAEEEEISKRNMELAQREYNLLLEKSKLADNSAEENEALSEAYVRMREAEKSYYDKSKEVIGQITEATNAYNAELAKIQEMYDKAGEALDKFGEKQDAQLQKFLDKNELDAIKEDNEFILQMEKDLKDELLEIDAELYAEQEKMRQKDLEDAEKIEQGKKDLQASTLNFATTILDSMADLMEQNSKGSEKEERKIKGLRIASSTITTLAGAAGAFAQASSTIPPPVGPILGAVNAATVIATGMAQIAKMRSTNVSASESAGGGSVAPVTVTPPTPTAEIPTFTNITGQRQEEAINQGQRVYIVSSDLEANGRRVQVQENETSF